MTDGSTTTINGATHAATTASPCRLADSGPQDSAIRGEPDDFLTILERTMVLR